MSCRMPWMRRAAANPEGGNIPSEQGTIRRWIPAGAATVLTALYAIGYLIWERSQLGSAELRDLVGNIAFMPLNLAVLTLNGLASRNPTLDPGVRKALRLFALGASMVFIGNAVSVYYL